MTLRDDRTSVLHALMDKSHEKTCFREQQQAPFEETCPASFDVLRMNYLVVILSIMLADGLQGMCFLTILSIRRLLATCTMFSTNMTCAVLFVVSVLICRNSSVCIVRELWIFSLFFVFIRICDRCSDDSTNRPFH